jgi:ABC-type transporter Mla subunit MlaD
VDQDPKLSATLAEIERLLAEAHRAGDNLPVWLDQLAVELREVAPGSGARADLARRILSDPRLSLVAQANIDAAALRSLDG